MLDIKKMLTDEYRELLDQCAHCGLCLEACPTYAIFGTEMDAPRGRIALMRAAVDGRITHEQFLNSFAEHITLCLECRACETACPSGVQYGKLIEGALVLEKNQLAERLPTELESNSTLEHLDRAGGHALGIHLAAAVGSADADAAFADGGKHRIAVAILEERLDRIGFFEHFDRVGVLVGPGRGRPSHDHQDRNNNQTNRFHFSPPWVLDYNCNL